MKTSRQLFFIFFLYAGLMMLPHSGLICQDGNWVKRIEISQHASKWKDYYHVTGPGGWWIPKDLWSVTLGLNFMMGRKMGERWELGAGLGVDYNDKQVFTSIPLSVYLNYSFKGSAYGHFYLRIGGGLGPGFVSGEENEWIKETLKMEQAGLDIGRYIAFKKSNGMSVSLGYRLQKDIYRSESESGWWSDLRVTTFVRNQVCLRMAFLF